MYNMSNIVYLNTLQPGDRVVLPKSSLGLIQHHALYVGKDNVGNRLYIENAIGRGVQIITESYLFKDGYQITRIERFHGSPNQRQMAVRSAIKMLGKQYDLINFNCEHYANNIQHRRSYSHQVENGLVLGLIALLLGAGLTKV